MFSGSGSRVSHFGGCQGLELWVEGLGIGVEALSQGPCVQRFPVVLLQVQGLHWPLVLVFSSCDGRWGQENSAIHAPTTPKVVVPAYVGIPATTTANIRIRVIVRTRVQPVIAGALTTT